METHFVRRSLRRVQKPAIPQLFSHSRSKSNFPEPGSNPTIRVFSQFYIESLIPVVAPCDNTDDG
jgi:hypothetical protein